MDDSAVTDNRRDYEYRKTRSSLRGRATLSEWKSIRGRWRQRATRPWSLSTLKELERLRRGELVLRFAESIDDTGLDEATE